MKSYKGKFFCVLFAVFSMGNLQAENRLLNLVGVRCSPDFITPDEFVHSRHDALAKGCINQEEYEWAETNAMSILCLGPAPKIVCACGCFDANVEITLGNGITKKPASTMSANDRASALKKSSKLDKPSFENRNIVYTTKGVETTALY